MIALPNPIIEKYDICNRQVYVVRDDLCSPFPGPNFSKIRGLFSHLQWLKEKMRVDKVVSFDTSISRVGWGVSYACSKIGGITNYNIYADRKEMKFYQQMSEQWGGVMTPVRGSFASAMVAQARKIVPDDAKFLLPGLRLMETYSEYLKIFEDDDLADLCQGGDLVVCSSSGAIASALIVALNRLGSRIRVNSVMSSPILSRKRKMVQKIADAQKVFDISENSATLLVHIDFEYKYSKPVLFDCPFPCDIYLDRKAWKWLVENLDRLSDPVIFWNIGGEWNPYNGLEHGRNLTLRGDGIVSQNQIESFLTHNQENTFKP